MSDRRTSFDSSVARDLAEKLKTMPQGEVWSPVLERAADALLGAIKEIARLERVREWVEEQEKSFQEAGAWAEEWELDAAKEVRAILEDDPEPERGDA